jgi:hypothetical protein
VIFSEQKLSVQVTDLDVIIVSAVHFTFWSATNTHQSKCLDVFTTERASTDHKSLDLSQLFLYVTSEDLNLVVVSAVGRSTVDLSFWNRLENIVVQPLLQWAVLAGVLDNFLCNYSTEECRLGNYGACGVNGSAGDNIFFNFFKRLSLFGFSLFIDALSDR